MIPRPYCNPERCWPALSLGFRWRYDINWANGQALVFGSQVVQPDMHAVYVAAVYYRAIFHSEIDQLTHKPEFIGAVQGNSSASLNDIVEQSKMAKPGWELVFLVWDDEQPIIRAVMGESMNVSEGTAYFLTFDRRTGKRLLARSPNEGIMFFLLDLHGSLLAGLPGALFLGLMGVLFAVSVISGLVVYAPYMRRLPFSILTLVQPLSLLWKHGQLAEIAAEYQGTALTATVVGPDRIRDAVFTNVPDADISFMSMPGSPYATPHHYTVALRGNTPLTERLIKLAIVDAETGQLEDIKNTPWYLTMVNLSVPLHFGDYGGLPLKIIWAVLDLITIVVLGSGVYLWLARGRKGAKRVEEIYDAAAQQQEPPHGDSV